MKQCENSATTALTGVVYFCVQGRSDPNYVHIRIYPPNQTWCCLVMPGVAVVFVTSPAPSTVSLQPAQITICPCFIGGVVIKVTPQNN